MVAVPADMPVTIPAALTVATASLPLLHVPPVVASASVVAPPVQIASVPVIGAIATAFTDIGLVTVNEKQALLIV